MNNEQEIAAAAARWVVEEGLEYGAAKKRAARELGVQRAALPSNETVEMQVREYLALFCADTQPKELRALREVAWHWMQRMAEFRPHLAGAVWRGTATRLSTVRLELYCDDPKAAELALVNANVDYDIGALPSPGRGDISVLTVATHSRALNDLVTVHMSIYDHDDLRGALKPDPHGLAWRGDMAALSRLLEAEDGALTK